ncbi:class I SAM-dependent DNA methyltransferase [Pseudonocardia humida]|uniref:Methyltransferase domain-containing protein n=1 Tax=Pseudonocardia humida TaxID=2800819 RepID=A0ABT0ZU62_9PSEU|nr:class I SAM-dependent methyltransferase [Pseudonocardia humida]MCO1654262.1 methyltransferase domain-containing protein [Pseudonocardia humida]
MQQPPDLDIVRASYDRVADTYVDRAVGDLVSEPWLRAALAGFAESVRGLGPVLDVGCGPGTVTAHLAQLGLDVSGIDLSPRMVEHARRLHSGQRFTVASATELDLAPESLGGVLGWWSLFNLPRDVLPGVLTSFASALLPRGQALIGTHVGDGDLVRSQAYWGIPVSWTTHLWRPEELVALLESAGLDVVVEMRLSVPPMGSQVLLVAQRPVG